MTRSTRLHAGFLVPLTLALVVSMAPVAAAAPTWAVVTTPNPGTTNSINGLVAFSPTEVWGIGNATSSSYTGCKGRTLTTRWNGTAFVEVPDTHTPVCAAINGVAGTSTSDIWAVGSANGEARDTHLRHWNGSGWSVVPGATIPVPPSGGRRLRTTGLHAVTTLSPTNAWAVGGSEYADFSHNTLVEHWNGSAWSLVPAAGAEGSVLRGVAAVAPANVWAVGSGGSSGSATFATLIEHWNGTTWATVPSPNASTLNYLRGVAAISANDVWAVGDSIKNPSDGVSVYSPLIEHWNGTAWTVVPAPKVGKGSNSLAAVAARSANDVWAVGFYDSIAANGFQTRRTLVEHWNGSAWTVSTSPNPGTGDNWLNAVVAPAGTSQVFASGTSAAGTLIERLSG